jgi:retinoblastoma-like protein 1
MPSAELGLFLSKCDKDVTDDVIRRARVILEAIFPSSGAANLMDSIWSEQRRLEATKLYFKVLQAMCRQEAQILHANNLTSLLNNERFHRCMLVCSAELVLATHKTVTMLFPSVLEKTGITSFDLSKVIESFIRHEESLPRELRRHLNSLEERLLESLVWEKGSSMYNSLTVARPSLSAEISQLGLLAEPMPSLDLIAMHNNTSSLQKLKHELSPGQNGDIRSPKRLRSEYRSPLVERTSFTSPAKERFLALNNLKPKPAPPGLQLAFASPTKPNPGKAGETCAETAINVFFSKIVKLAAVRINGMVDRIQLTQQIKENVYRLFQQILNQRTTLFFNRHIDQIILCCFYVIAKVSKLNLTLKEIICNYRKQPHCKPQFIFDEIKKFYNDDFVPGVKTLLSEYSLVGNAQQTDQVSATNSINEGECPLSPKVSPFPSIPDMSPKKVSATHNVYVSPLRSSKVDALVSHSSKSYYACVGESTHAFQSPSKDLTAINNHLNGSSSGRRKMLKFEDGGEDAAGLVSDSVVASSLYLPKAIKTEQV